MILSLISFVLGIIALFIQPVSYVNWVIQIVAIIVLILALGNIKNAGNALNNENLLDFRFKIILALILNLIGLIIITVGWVSIVAIATGPDPGSSSAAQGYITFGIVIIAGIIILILGVVMEILAWGRLKNFFRNNKGMFPEGIGSSGESGSLLLQIGAILNLTVIFIFVGFILRVIGYYKLSALKDLE